MRQTRQFRLALALAFILNVGGSPMAWSQWLGSHPGDAVAADSAAGCHGHGTSASQDPHSAPAPTCCDGGGCSCAAPAVPSLDLSQAARIPHAPFSASIGAPAPAAPLPDETLRPPIY